MELIVEHIYEKMQCKFYIRTQKGDQTIMIGYDGEKLVEQIMSVGEATDIKPLLTIPLGMKEFIIKAFINEGAKQNLRTENENLLKGKLEATELHLEDMRHFFFKEIN